MPDLSVREVAPASPGDTDLLPGSVIMLDDHNATAPGCGAGSTHQSGGTGAEDDQVMIGQRGLPCDHQWNRRGKHAGADA